MNDPHRANASKLFGIGPKDVTKEQRDHAKRRAYAELYGGLVGFDKKEPPPYHCKYCGAPSYVDPSDQTPPPAYCHEGDHGEPE